VTVAEAVVVTVGEALKQYPGIDVGLNAFVVTELSPSFAGVHVACAAVVSLECKSYTFTQIAGGMLAADGYVAVVT